MAIEQEDIRQLRRGLDESQTVFWAKFGISISFASNIERLKSKVPPLVLGFINLTYGNEPLKKLAELRNTDISTLIKDGK